MAAGLSEESDHPLFIGCGAKADGVALLNPKCHHSGYWQWPARIAINHGAANDLCRLLAEQCARHNQQDTQKEYKQATIHRAMVRITTRSAKAYSVAL